MDSFFILAIAAGVLVGVLLTAIIVLILHIRSSGQINRLTFPAYEYAVKKAEHEADALVREAQTQAREIITKAEAAGQQSINTYTKAAEHIQATYQEALTNQSKELLQQFAKATEEQTSTMHDAVKHVQESFVREYKEVEQNIVHTNETLIAMASEAEQHTKKVIASIETNISATSKKIDDSLLSAEEKGLHELATHFASLEQMLEKEVAAYGDNRKKLIDTHVERLVEDVVAQVLQTDLPVSTHASLARKALEDAKAKNIL